MTGLPEGWAACRLSEICVKIVDGSHNPPDKQTSGKPMLSAVNVDNNQISFSQFRLIDHKRWDDEDRRTRIAAGDILLTIVGAIGKVAVVPEGIRPFTLQRSVAVLTPAEVSSRYLMYQLEEPSVAQFFKENARGTAQKGVYLKTLGTTPIKLAPLPEQHRIVAKIEELFSELDAGTASLTRARGQLKTYRQALLKAAFEGRLTAPWRAANEGKLDSPETLLSRIRTERYNRHAAALDDWQTALSEWRADGEAGRKPGKPSRPDSLSELATSNAVFDGWPIFELRDLISVSSGQGLTSSEMNGGRHPVYGGNGITGFHDQWFLKEPNLIIGRVGAKCGVTHITQEFAWVTDNALIVTPLVDSFDQRFFLYRLEYMNLNALGSSTGQPVISGSKIYGQEIALPTQGEQSAVADIIEALDSGCAKLSDEITTALTRITALRQSILKKAFSGQLVPQDPADEPASTLLARLAKTVPKPRRKTIP